ncbi:hypothetical protein F0919_14560 [Taibaiella lutea]|uniref:Uncharacterized protein n=1 Tax=Taibaiella lutea TaxID=2608001 RepID=A0A5M6CH50_9BACT|nr:hypothetical protein [Taibaiella lutea]KAA5533750.1 hypothetical protein F0919_14560 [Taibaiella lutea]
MNKNFIVVVLPLTDTDDYIDIPKCAFFSEIDEAKEYIEKMVFKETGDYYALPNKPSDIRIKLSDKILELWVCYIPNPVFLN